VSGVGCQVSATPLTAEAASLIEKETVPFWHSFIRAAPLAKKTASLIGKETDERRTSNVQHRTSNNVFCPF
jgi:hypothetical protein